MLLPYFIIFFGSLAHIDRHLAVVLILNIPRLTVHKQSDISTIFVRKSNVQDKMKERGGKGFGFSIIPVSQAPSVFIGEASLVTD